ncbi:MAG TPA: hypothetical protein VMC84_11885 [Methanocella sp.]|nr:hypothetical protein [Methanocella sp.]HTY91866.1 hypothetical protein [Methanocella sp.]
MGTSADVSILDQTPADRRDHHHLAVLLPPGSLRESAACPGRGGGFLISS